MTWLGNIHLLRWQDAVDFVVLAAALYLLIRWATEARALRLALGIVGLHAASIVARHFNLVITGWVLEGAAVVTVILLVMVFQPEIRRALMGLDSRLRSLSRRTRTLAGTYRRTADAAFSLGSSRTGALIVFVRTNSITELTDGGIDIGAEISPELLEAIFNKWSPLHDGAVIVEGGRIARARVFLPLTQRTNLPRSWGSRHRAAVGLAERSDALVLTVSEQSGEVHIMSGRSARLVENAASLVGILEDIHIHPKRSIPSKLRRVLFANLKPKLAALGLALMLWVTSSLVAMATVRTINVPVEFSNVPAGLVVSGQSATEVRIQLRGSEWLLDSVDLTRVVAHFDLREIKEGWQTLSLQPDTLDLPPGIVVEQVSPRTISVRLAHRQG